MSEVAARLRDALTTWLITRSAEVRAAFSVGFRQEDTAEQSTDFILETRLQTMFANNPASQYIHGAPGYLTSNGLGSLEIGAADD